MKDFWKIPLFTTATRTCLSNITFFVNHMFSIQTVLRYCTNAHVLVNSFLMLLHLWSHIAHLKVSPQGERAYISQNTLSLCICDHTYFTTEELLVTVKAHVFLNCFQLHVYNYIFHIGSPSDLDDVLVIHFLLYI